MSVNENEDRFRAQYCSFLDKVRKGLEACLQVSASESAEQLLKHVFEELQDDKGLDAVESAASEELSPAGKKALGWELQFLAEGEFKPDEAKTAKDSIEKLIGRRLPKRIRDLLEVLNEIFKIASGRGGDPQE